MYNQEKTVFTLLMTHNNIIYTLNCYEEARKQTDCFEFYEDNLRKRMDISTRELRHLIEKSGLLLETKHNGKRMVCTLPISELETMVNLYPREVLFSSNDKQIRLLRHMHLLVSSKYIHIKKTDYATFKYLALKSRYSLEKLFYKISEYQKMGMDAPLDNLEHYFGFKEENQSTEKTNEKEAVVC